MELYINNKWTECYGNCYIAEAIACSENGNHASIYATGDTTKEAEAKLLGALRELRLIPQAPAKNQDRHEQALEQNGEADGSANHQ